MLIVVTHSGFWMTLRAANDLIDLLAGEKPRDVGEVGKITGCSQAILAQDAA